MTNPMQFPNGFVFGGATAAYQVEGETRTHGKGKVPGTISWQPRVASPPTPQAISTTSTRSISTCAGASASTVSASPSLGAASSPAALARSTPRVSPSITSFSPPAIKPALSPMSRSITSIRPSLLPERRRGLPDAHDDRRLCRVRQVLLCRVHRGQALVYL